MINDRVILSRAEWSAVIRGMACIEGDDGRVELMDITDLGEAWVACEDGHQWVLPAPLPVSEDGVGRGGMLEELGVYQTLIDVLVPGDPFVEYGVVEHRFATAAPRLYADLVQRYGHTALAPRRYTVSALLAGALAGLAADGSVTRTSGPATGRWSYNTQISYWALSPAEDRTPLSWTDFAAGVSIGPDSWPSTEGLEGPTE